MISLEIAVTQAALYFKCSANIHFMSWCRRAESNRHGRCPPPPQDGVSTNFTTSAILTMLFIREIVKVSQVDRLVLQVLFLRFLL